MVINTKDINDVMNEFISNIIDKYHVVRNNHKKLNSKEFSVILDLEFNISQLMSGNISIIKSEYYKELVEAIDYINSLIGNYNKSFMTIIGKIANKSNKEVNLNDLSKEELIEIIRRK